MKKVSLIAAIGLVALIVTNGCKHHASLEGADMKWKSYTSPDGYTVNYPALWDTMSMNNYSFLAAEPEYDTSDAVRECVNVTAMPQMGDNNSLDSTISQHSASMLQRHPNFNLIDTRKTTNKTLQLLAIITFKAQHRNQPVFFNTIILLGKKNTYYMTLLYQKDSISNSVIDSMCKNFKAN